MKQIAGGIMAMTIVIWAGIGFLVQAPGDPTVDGQSFQFEGTRFVGHADTVLQVELSRDKTRLVSTSMDHTVRLWDARSGACLWTRRGEWGWFENVEFSSDGRFVGGRQGQSVHVWDSKTGLLVRTVQGTAIAKAFLLCDLPH